ncbi:MAG: DUF4397 domain-containing protein [Bacteroidaceae bacterium]|nr:DUF4397 domain-containing protein [Bacteroidaceae bacterium]
MPIDFSFLENAAPPKQEQPEQKPDTGIVNVTVRVDADCFMQCDGEYVDIQLKAGQVTKTELPTGQHLLEFLSTENPNVKVEKMVDFPESGKNYLVVVNELKAAIAPPMPQGQPQQATPQNPFLDQLNQMQWNNPLAPPAMPQMPPSMPGENK